jgi:hypothetical protein
MSTSKQPNDFKRCPKSPPIMYSITYFIGGTGGGEKGKRGKKKE